MTSFDDGSQFFFNEKQAHAPGTSTPSKILELCAMLEAALIDFRVANAQLDGDYWTSSPTADVEAALRQIRAARLQCNKMADELLEASPDTISERNAVNNVMTTYLAHVGADRMTCCLRLDAMLGSERPGSGAKSSETKSARVFPLNILPRKGWSKVSFPPKSR